MITSSKYLSYSELSGGGGGINQGQLPLKKCKWLHEEDEKLLYLRNVKKITSWREISKHFPTKDNKQCMYRYRKIYVNKTIVKWSKEEDELLASLVEKKGEKFGEFVRYFHGKKEKDLFHRYYKAINPSILVFSKKEDELILQMYEKSHPLKFKDNNNNKSNDQFNKQSLSCSNFFTKNTQLNNNTQNSLINDDNNNITQKKNFTDSNSCLDKLNSENIKNTLLKYKSSAAIMKRLEFLLKQRGMEFDKAINFTTLIENYEISFSVDNSFANNDFDEIGLGCREGDKNSILNLNDDDALSSSNMSLIQNLNTTGNLYRNFMEKKQGFFNTSFENNNHVCLVDKEGKEENLKSLNYHINTDILKDLYNPDLEVNFDNDDDSNENSIDLKDDINQIAVNNQYYIENDNKIISNNVKISQINPSYDKEMSYNETYPLSKQTKTFPFTNKNLDFDERKMPESSPNFFSTNIDYNCIPTPENIFIEKSGFQVAKDFEKNFIDIFKNEDKNVDSNTNELKKQCFYKEHDVPEKDLFNLDEDNKDADINMSYLNISGFDNDFFRKDNLEFKNFLDDLEGKNHETLQEFLEIDNKEVFSQVKSCDIKNKIPSVQTETDSNSLILNTYNENKENKENYLENIKKLEHLIEKKDTMEMILAKVLEISNTFHQMVEAKIGTLNVLQADNFAKVNQISIFRNLLSKVEEFQVNYYKLYHASNEYLRKITKNSCERKSPSHIDSNKMDIESEIIKTPSEMLNSLASLTEIDEICLRNEIICQIKLLNKMIKLSKLKINLFKSVYEKF